MDSAFARVAAQEHLFGERRDWALDVEFPARRCNAIIVDEIVTPWDGDKPVQISAETNSE
jgi:hypothetical protein